MIKIVSHPADIKGFVLTDLYCIHEYDERNRAVSDLAAIATSKEEAHDAQEMLVDLTGHKYYICPPSALAN